MPGYRSMNPVSDDTACETPRPFAKLGKGTPAEYQRGKSGLFFKRSGKSGKRERQGHGSQQAHAESYSRSQLLWTICVAVALMFLALQQIFSSRNVLWNPRNANESLSQSGSPSRKMLTQPNAARSLSSDA